MEYWWKDNWQGKTKVLGGKPTLMPLFTINLARTLGLNLGLHDERPLTNCLSYGIASLTLSNGSVFPPYQV
jgi:hypothetical protein